MFPCWEFIKILISLIYTDDMCFQKLLKWLQIYIDDNDTVEILERLAGHHFRMAVQNEG